MDIYLLGGKRHKAIADYLSDKGINVKQSVERLTESVWEELIDVDKFVIVDSDFDIASNMGIFMTLLNCDFFNAKEIVFIGDTNRTTSLYFKAALEKANRPIKFRRYEEEELSSPTIYLLILDQERDTETKVNIYSNVYRELEETKTIITEDPIREATEHTTFRNYSDLIKYDKLKEELVYSKDEMIQDSSIAPRIVSQSDVNEDIEQLEKFVEKGNPIVVETGEPKSGVSTSISTLVSSLVKLDKSILVIDCKQNESTTQMITNFYEPSVLNMKDCKNNLKLLEDYFSDDEETLCVVNMNASVIDKDIILSLLRMIEKYFYQFHIVIFDIPLGESQYNNILYKANKLFINCPNREIDVKSLIRTINSLGLKRDFTLITTAVFNEISDINFLETRDIKKLIKNNTECDVKITSKFQVNGLASTEVLATKLVGTVLEESEKYYDEMLEELDRKEEERLAKLNQAATEEEIENDGEGGEE